MIRCTVRPLRSILDHSRLWNAHLGYVSHVSSRWLSSDASSAHRHTGIAMHPESISKSILPGNFVMRETRRGTTQKRYTELVYGYFWMLKDLQRSDNKPILSNEHLIPEKKAKIFPSLPGCKTLSGEKVDLPDFFIRKNRAKQEDAQCTLVAISFRDFGFQLLPSWIDPFEQALGTKDRVEIMKLNISEGWLNKWILRGFIQGLTAKNTPKEQHDSTLLCFASDLEAFRDALRMHNVMTGYIFLLDGLGRVRFAGSGTATEQEVQRLVKLAKELTPLLKPLRQRQSARPRRTKK